MLFSMDLLINFYNFFYYLLQHIILTIRVTQHFLQCDTYITYNTILTQYDIYSIYNVIQYLQYLQVFFPLFVIKFTPIIHVFIS